MSDTATGSPGESAPEEGVSSTAVPPRNSYQVESELMAHYCRVLGVPEDSLKLTYSSHDSTIIKRDEESAITMAVGIVMSIVGVRGVTITQERIKEFDDKYSVETRHDLDGNNTYILRDKS